MPPAGKVDRAVAFINARAQAIAGEIFAIGEYLLAEFFDGDTGAVADRRSDKLNSFRDLAARPDLQIGYVTLWRAVQLVVQERLLATVSRAKQLTMSHKIELLPIKSPEQKLELARRAAAEGWIRDRLRDEVRLITAAEEPAPPTRSELAHAIDDLERVTRAAERGPLAPESLDDVPPEGLETVVRLLEKAHAALGRAVAVGARLLRERAKSG